MRTWRRPIYDRAFGGLAAFCLAAAMVLPASVGKGGPAKRREAARQLRSPVRIALRHNNRVLVTDSRERVVFVLDAKSLQTFQIIPIVGEPLGIACSKSRIYVGNATRGRVEVYDPSGGYLHDLPGPEGHFKQPTDIAVDKDHDHLFVVDGRDGVVKVFTTDGKFIRQIASHGTAIDQLAQPTGIAVDVHAQEVFVSDFGKPEIGVRPRIQIYDYTGNFLGQIRSRTGMLGLRFSRPQGLDVDGKGHLFVVDSLLGQVLVFDRASGALLKTIGEFGADPGQLQLPLDVMLHRSNDLLVTNNRCGRVEVFVGGGVLP